MRAAVAVYLSRLAESQFLQSGAELRAVADDDDDDTVGRDDLARRARHGLRCDRVDAFGERRVVVVRQPEGDDLLEGAGDRAASLPASGEGARQAVLGVVEFLLAERTGADDLADLLQHFQH